ncbi:10811_t:CDS:2 [Funneliformis caledonium]|uniref:10811_t:CDS:1 n=1 Tax=Funneliformis caledonium TaxID=1117310 RepID=A0A9N9NB47_9GLOM|nr:10811_t:CDS:2 [Funneliformis caledonium]
MSKEFTSKHPNREQLTILMTTKTIKWHHIKDLRLRIPSSSISVKYRLVTSKSLQKENLSKNIQMLDHDLALFSDNKQHIFDIKLEPVITKRRRYDQFRQVNNIGINQNKESE